MAVSEEIKRWVAEAVAGWTSNNFFVRAIHQQTSRGTASRGLPIILDRDGEIDISFFDAAGDARYGRLAGANDWTQEQSITEANSTVYVNNTGVHSNYIALENSSSTTGSSAGIGLRVLEAGGLLIQRAFIGVVSIAGAQGPDFVIKLRTGATTYLEVLRISLSGLAVFSGTVQLAGFLKYTASAKTISGGAITATGTYMTVDTEGAAATDDLDTINGGVDGQIIIIRANSSARDVVIRDGAGNISTPANRTLNHVDDVWVGYYNSARWCEMSFTDNAA
jgi:hypothetical protein